VPRRSTSSPTSSRGGGYGSTLLCAHGFARTLGRVGVESLAIDAEIALDAAQLPLVGDPFDRIIYTTAVAKNPLLVTRDERLRELGGDRAVW